MKDNVLQAVDEQRLLDTAQDLIAVPSPTLDAGAAADALASILTTEGFAVERPPADWPPAPAVVARLDSGRPGRVLQFDGHLDTVHLPFVPPKVEDGQLYGSGASDMKGGIAAFVEALRALRDAGAPTQGAILLTAHDHHEAPWGDRRQLLALIRAGLIGDGVLLPEYLGDTLPVAGRGLAVFSVAIERDGVPVHEVLRPAGLPDVLAAGAEVVGRLNALNEHLREQTAPYVGSDSLFIGRIEGGQLYNQVPTQCRVEGTRRWVTAGAASTARRQIEARLAEVATASGTRIRLADWNVPGDAFALAPNSPLVGAFQSAHEQVTGKPLPLGGKPFIDDGNVFMAAGIEALTHGPCAVGAHTTDEQVAVAELVRVAKVYALTAQAFC